MCRVLKIARATYYYESKPKTDETERVSEVKKIFRQSRNNYGTRKIKRELAKRGKIVKQKKIIVNFKSFK